MYPHVLKCVYQKTLTVYLNYSMCTVWNLCIINVLFISPNRARLNLKIIKSNLKYKKLKF